MTKVVGLNRVKKKVEKLTTRARIWTGMEVRMKTQMVCSFCASWPIAMRLTMIALRNLER